MSNQNNPGYHKRKYSSKFEEVQQNNNNSQQNQQPQDDVDEHGNIKDLIDYDFDNTSNRPNKRQKRRRSKRLRNSKDDDNNKLVELFFDSDYSEESTTKCNSDESITLSSDDDPNDRHHQVLPPDVYHSLIHNRQNINNLPLPLQYSDDPVNILQPNPILEYYSKLTPA